MITRSSVHWFQQLYPILMALISWIIMIQQLIYMFTLSTCFYLDYDRHDSVLLSDIRDSLYNFFLLYTCYTSWYLRETQYTQVLVIVIRLVGLMSANKEYGTTEPLMGQGQGYDPVREIYTTSYVLPWVICDYDDIYTIQSRGLAPYSRDWHFTSESAPSCLGRYHFL